MARTIEYAAKGDIPTFVDPLHVAQLNMPTWEELESAFRGIFERQYFANNGPLVQALDSAIAEKLGVKHAICMTNGTVALMTLAESLNITGDVIVPAFTFPATVQSLAWAGLTPVFCDVDRGSHTITASLVEPLIGERTSAVLGVHLWGRACDPGNLQSLCNEYGLSLIYDACHAFGCRYEGKYIGGLGRGEAFSLHATKIVNACEGGCVTTNDDDLAHRLRTIRNFHRSETYASVPLRFNAKMSEAQAAFGLLGLNELEENIRANKKRFLAYQEELNELDGITVIDYPEDNNYEYVVIEVDEPRCGVSRDALVNVLRSENILCRRHFYPGVHRMRPFSSANVTLEVTESLCDSVFQLPNGQSIALDDVAVVCSLIKDILNTGASL